MDHIRGAHDVPCEIKSGQPGEVPPSLNSYATSVVRFVGGSALGNFDRHAVV